VVRHLPFGREGEAGKQEGGKKKKRTSLEGGGRRFKNDARVSQEGLKSFRLVPRLMKSLGCSSRGGEKKKGTTH